MIELLKLMPVHECTCTLEHNGHKIYYQTVESYGGEEKWFAWVSPAQHELAAAHNEMWTIQWYPRTPVGFHGLAAYDLDVLLAAARDVN